jgi:hypothetical protein
MANDDLLLSIEFIANRVHCRLSSLPIANCQLPIEFIADCQFISLPIANCRLPIADCQLPIADCRLPIANCRLPIAD